MATEILSKTNILIGGKSYTYYRPSQSREIPLKAMSNRGFLPSLKSHRAGLILECESQLERNFYLLLDQDPNCIDLQPQPVQIKYKTVSGKEKVIFPDCWALFSDNQEFLFEVKPEHRLKKMMQDDNWPRRLEAIQTFCKQKGWKYQIITERKIQSTRLNNIKDFLAAAKHFSPASFTKELGQFDTVLKSFLKTPKDFVTLARSLSALLSLPLEEIISLLKYKLYFQHLYFDWNQPFENTPISLSGEPPIPVHSMPDFDNVESSEDQAPVESPANKHKIITGRSAQVFESRLALITPIINQFGKNAKKRDILTFCQGSRQSFNQTYKYYRRWKKEGKDGLYFKRQSCHQRAHFEVQSAQLLQDYIQRWNHSDWEQIKDAYEDYRKECIKLGLKPASAETFRQRLRKLPATERRGKFKTATQSRIDRVLTDTYREGRYPGAVIQMDHTKLDIWLVDSFTKQPLGRPWLTLGIDVFSRSIWGFFLSFDNPSQESVTQAILSGLMKKDQLKDWKEFEARLVKDGKDPNDYQISCAGFPACIQVDNGKEFQAGSVKDFCCRLNITLEFRPIHTPEYGGFIESVWDTINDGIRSCKLKGRVFPLPKERKAVSQPKFVAPTGYDPQKDATLTMEDFREWLMTFLVITYSSQPRSHQSHSPNEIWRDGLCGDRFQPLGGALQIMNPEDYARFNFQSKIAVQSSLSKKGFRYHNLLYSSEWLKQARKDRILSDGTQYEFRVSHWDVRTIEILNPVTSEIEILKFYNYEGDDRITKFIRRGLGQESGYNPFPISMTLLKEVKKRLGKSSGSGAENLLLVDKMMENLNAKSETNKKERKYFEKIAGSQNGAEIIATAKRMTQMDEKPLPAIEVKSDNAQILQTNETEESEEDDQIIPYPTEWKDAKRNLIYSSLKENEEKKPEE